MRCFFTFLLLVGTSTAFAQSDPPPVFADDPADPEPPDSNQGYPNQGYPTAQCAGGCPPGMTCSPDGVCETSTCSGGCPQGMTCSSDGVCESSACAGGCPTGMACSRDGVCETVALGVAPPPGCNCPQGFACTAAGTCAPVQVGQQVGSRAGPSYDPNLVRKARRRSTLGFVSAGIVLAVGVTAAIFEGNDNDSSCFGRECGIPEGPLLLANAAILGLTGIFTYGGSGAARRAGGSGFGILRIGGWITWIGGLALTILSGGIAMLDGSEPTGVIYAASALGAVGLSFWAIDARVAAGEADALHEQEQTGETARHWGPSIRVLRDSERRVIGGTLGATFEL